MQVWIQRHNHSTDDHSALDQEACLDLLASFDWESELANYERALDENRDRCPPGMGFVDGDRTLHVMPIHDGRSHYHYSCDHPARLLALFGASKELNIWNVPDQFRHELIALHYASDQPGLVRALLKHSK